MKRPSFLIIASLTLGFSAVALSGGGRNASILVGNVLLQDTTPGTAQLGHANVTGTFRAGQMIGTSNVATTTPVIGNNNSTDPNAVGGSFSSFSQSGIGVRSTATNTGGSAKAMYAEARGAQGTAVDAKAMGRYGYGLNATVTGSDGIGVRAIGDGSNSVGVYGDAGNVGLWGLGNNHGVRADCTANDAGSTLHAGVYSLSQNSSGKAYGVYGYAVASGLEPAYGVAGHGFSSGSSWGLYAFGNSGATGTKSFEIDHPISPESMTLRHYSAEGAEPLLVYSGNIKLDAKGRATVQVPEYVAEIGRDWRYQLTAIGAPMPDLYIAKSFASGTFGVAGGVPGANVSWSLTGVRNDRWVRKNGAPVEVPKPASMQGRYLEPTLYGKGESAGINTTQEPTRR